MFISSFFYWNIIKLFYFKIKVGIKILTEDDNIYYVDVTSVCGLRQINGRTLQYVWHMGMRSGSKHLILLSPFLYLDKFYKGRNIIKNDFGRNQILVISKILIHCK